jgi:hypothetical protein
MFLSLYYLYFFNLSEILTGNKRNGFRYKSRTLFPTRNVAIALRECNGAVAVVFYSEYCTGK